MSWTAIFGAIASFAAIVGGVVYLVKRADWSFSKTQDQIDQGIEDQNEKDKQKAEDTGRPV